MKLKIGFACDTLEKENEPEICCSRPRTIVPRKSVVRVKFPAGGSAYSYYNDMFDLQEGDMVYVDGKMEGEIGRVIDVNYNFKINLSEYKRVIALADTEVKGQLHYAGSHLIAFERNVIPAEKIIRWFKAPNKPNDEIICGNDDSVFSIGNLKGMNVSSAIAERGHEYYVENRVVYLSLDKERGYAIVDGSDAYEVEFEYRGGEISNLTCSCFCCYNCKHEFAAMLQLRDILEHIENDYNAQFEKTDYFAAIFKDVFFSLAVGGKDIGSITLG